MSRCIFSVSMFNGTRRITFLALIGLVVALLVGCLGDADGQSDARDASSSTSLVIYAARNEELIGPLIERFEQQSGVDTLVKYGDTIDLALALLDEGENSPADVFYTRDPGGLGATSRMFYELPADILDAVPQWARSTEGKWVGTSARARVVVYNTDSLSEHELPDSIHGFTDAKWKGRIGWSPMSGPTQAMFTAMRVMWGEKRAGQWLEGVIANEPVLYPNHTAAVAGVVSGEVDVAFVNHYYLHRFFAESNGEVSARNYHFRDGGPGNLLLVAGAGILSTSKNRENAEKFLRFLLTEDAQTYLTDEALDYPLVDSVPANPVLQPLSEVEIPELDQGRLSDIEGTLDLMRQLEVIP